MRIRIKMVPIWRGNINYFRVMSLMSGTRSMFSRYVCAVCERVCLLINMYSRKSSSPNNVKQTQMCRRHNEELLNLKREHKEAFISMIKNIL